MTSSAESRAPVQRKQLQVGDVINESWRLVKGLKWPIFWSYVLVSLAVMSIILLVAGQLFSFVHIAYVPFNNGTTTVVRPEISINKVIYLVFILAFFIEWYVFSNAVVLGVRKSINLPIKVKSIFLECMRQKKDLFILFLAWLVCAAVYHLLSNVLVPYLPLMLVFSILLRVILYILFLFVTLPIVILAVPLCVIKRCGAQHALTSSFQMMQIHGIKIILCFVAIFVIYLLSAIPLGIGLIWTVPMRFTMMGVIFRDVYGLKPKA